MNAEKDTQSKEIPKRVLEKKPVDFANEEELNV